MGSAVKLHNPQQALAIVTNAPLGDSAVGPELLTATLEGGQTFAGQALSVNLQGDLQIQAFNSADDEDADGVLNAPGADASGHAVPAALHLEQGSAFLKYRGEVALKALGGGSVGALGFAFDGAASMVLADYHRHAHNDGTRDAVLSDLGQLRTSLRIQDVLDLDVNEAVAQQLHARLTVAAQVSWADVMMGPLAPVSLLTGGRPILVKLNGGATLSARVSVTDDFTLVLSRADAHRWRCGLRKARTRAAGLGVSLGVTVEFANKKELQALLAAVIDGLVGVPMARIDALVKKAALSSLSDAERTLALALMERLGLDPITSTLETLATKIELLKTSIAGAVQQVAHSRLTAAFGYEYARMRQDATVVQCALTEAALRAHHADLIRGRLDGLLEASTLGGGVTLEHFLNQSTIRTERSWGFALSIGKWQVGGTDRRALERVQRRSALGHAQDSVLGVRTYRHAGDATPRWSVDFAADMPAYAQSPGVPRLSEFQYGIAVMWHEEARKLKVETLDEWLDLATLWGACSEGDRARHRETLRAVHGTRCRVVAQLVCPPAAFGLMRARIAAADPLSMASSLGAAVSWMNTAGRQSPALRSRLYGPLWQMYLADGSRALTGRDYGSAARAHLTREGFAELGAMEHLQAITPQARDPRTFCGLVDLNPLTRSECQSFFNGVARLQAGVVSAAPDAGVINQVFGQCEKFWGQELHVRAMGAYLLATADACGVLDHLSRSCAVASGADDDATTYVLGR